jgi:chromosome partitioning protein
VEHMISNSYIIAIANQKGGVGKTTSAVNISSELASRGHSVLLIDFDPQGSATSGVGVQLLEEGSDLFDVFFERVTLNDIIQPTQIQGLHIAPASKDLVGLEIELGKKPGRELILKTEIANLNKSYEYIIIDCPPSSGLLTLNALGVAQHILIPLQTEYYALEGISALMNTIHFVKNTFNPSLEIIGVFSTMYDSRTKLSAQVEEEVRAFFGGKMFPYRVPRNVKLSEAPSHGLPINVYDPSSIGAKAYSDVTSELIIRLEKGIANPQSAANG